MCFEARLALLQGFPGLVLRRNEGSYFLVVSRPIIGLVSVKEETEPKSITGMEFNIYCHFSLDFSSCSKSTFGNFQNMTASAGSLYQWRHKQSRNELQMKRLIRHEPSFFCSSLAKSEPTWPWSEKLKFEEKQTNKQKQQKTNLFCMIQTQKGLKRTFIWIGQSKKTNKQKSTTVLHWPIKISVLFNC